MYAMPSISYVVVKESERAGEAHLVLACRTWLHVDLLLRNNWIAAADSFRRRTLWRVSYSRVESNRHGVSTKVVSRSVSPSRDLVTELIPKHEFYAGISGTALGNFRRPPPADVCT